MNYLLSLMIITSFSQAVIFDFNRDADLKNWMVVDDVVMGGRSSGSFRLSDDGYGIFEGRVSLENYGGFSSARYRFQELEVGEYSHVVLRVKGDRKNYEFRIKANSRDYHSYITPFSTSGEWEEIAIPLKEMYPTFRGRKLNMPKFNQGQIMEIILLIANKKNENFQLLIDKVELR